MSIQRFVLREAFVAALKDVTIAGGRVFDTLIGTVQEGKADEYLPMICVYTDVDRRAQIETGSAGGGLFRRTIDVTLEVSIGCWKWVDSPETTSPQLLVGLIETDPELEAILDLFEMQIWQAIYNPLSAAAGALAGILKEVHSWNSLPGRSATTQNKISARQLTLNCEIKDDVRPPMQGGPACTYPALATIAPHLSDTFTRLATTSGFETMRDMIQLLTGVTTLPPVDQALRFGFTADFIEPTDVSRLPEGQTTGPDGKIDIAALVDLEEESP